MDKLVANVALLTNGPLPFTEYGTPDGGIRPFQSSVTDETTLVVLMRPFDPAAQQPAGVVEALEQDLPIIEWQTFSDMLAGRRTLTRALAMSEDLRAYMLKLLPPIKVKPRFTILQTVNARMDVAMPSRDSAYRIGF